MRGARGGTATGESGIDAHMIRAVVLGLVVLVGCASDEGKPATKNTSNAMNRPITPRSKLPAAILPLLPRSGVYIAGGGLMSPGWRVVLDLDAKTIYAGSTSKRNSPSFGPMEKESKRDLSQRNQEFLMGLAHAAWSEPPSKDPPHPTADNDEIFVVLEGDDTFFLEGYGPITQPAAAKAIIELRAAGGL